MLFKSSTDKSVAEAAAALQAAVQANRFGVMQIHNLQGGDGEEGRGVWS
jgi:hypothetical protein